MTATYKLQALFPVAMKNPVLDKNAPFAVCRSGLKDTTFNSWATLQHNVILNWVDVSEADGSAGLAVMSDHTTAYSFKAGEPLGLVCCYAGPGTWFDYALGRTPEISYALIPHSGNWDKANLWRHQADWSEPLVSTVVPKPASDPKGALVPGRGLGWERSGHQPASGQRAMAAADLQCECCAHNYRPPA